MNYCGECGIAVGFSLWLFCRGCLFRRAEAMKMQAVGFARDVAQDDDWRPWLAEARPVRGLLTGEVRS